MKIYTKGGDAGSTCLIGGERVPKYDARVEAYGTVDELTAQTGMLRDMLAAAAVEEFNGDLLTVLRTLMYIESLMAIGEGGEGKVSDIAESDITFLERRIDEITSLLPPIEKFTLPGGNVVVSQAHICRTVCRRAEREAYRAASEHDISRNALIYLNRFSDYLYVLGRRVAMLLDAEELLWIP